MENPLKILIVEDEFLIALNIQRQLIRLGYELCEPVASGEDAVRMVIQERPNLVLMDVNLAGSMDGLQTCTEIVQQVPGTAFIFMTGHIGERTMDEILDLDPLACLVKPILVRDVHQIISGWQQGK